MVQPVSGLRCQASLAVKVAFMLPGFTNKPVGGYKVAYEYANRLKARGHDVTLLFPRYMGRVSAWDLAVHRPIRAIVRRGRPPHVRWFTLDQSLRLEDRSRLHARHLSSFDTVVATSWRTAEDVSRLLRPGQRGIYLIQSYETWSGPADRVNATWRLPMVRVVVARWLETVARTLEAEPVEYVPNAIDAEVFRPVVALDDRPRRVMMLWHRDWVKGSDVGVRAMQALRSTHPEVQFTCFSPYLRPPGLPEWIDFRGTLNQSALAASLNESSIFISPSRLEGWALPPAEAMACGCALVATDIGGVRDYARHLQTALLVEPDDPTGLAAAVRKLLDDEDLRLELATAGARLLSDAFSWERSTDRLEGILAGQ